MSFHKMGTSLLYFYGRHLQQVTLIEDIGLCKEKHILLKIWVWRL